MKLDDEYQAWRAARRAVEPSADLPDRVMAAVRESRLEPAAIVRPQSVWKSALRRMVPYLVCSAAGLVLAVRFYSVLSIFVTTSAEVQIATNETVEEFHDVQQP